MKHESLAAPKNCISLLQNRLFNVFGGNNCVLTYVLGIMLLFVRHRNHGDDVRVMVGI